MSSLATPSSATRRRGGDRASSKAVPVVSRWRLVRDEPLPGSRNMALDHALAECLARRPGETEGVVRLYGWDRPTLSFGRNEPAEGRGAAAPGEWPGSGAGPGSAPLAFVRRPTGGRAVLHDDELTYAVIAPVRAWGGLRRAYRAINEALATALRSLGVPVEVAEEGPVLPPSAGPCFHAPAPGELTVAGRKLVGSAQARVGGALLQHGSILLGGRQLSSGAAITLREIIGPVGVYDVERAVGAAFETSFGGLWGEGGYRSEEEAAAVFLEATRYASESWTWRK